MVYKYLIYNPEDGWEDELEGIKDPPASLPGDEFCLFGQAGQQVIAPEGDAGSSVCSLALPVEEGLQHPEASAPPEECCQSLEQEVRGLGRGALQLFVWPSLLVHLQWTSFFELYIRLLRWLVMSDIPEEVSWWKCYGLFQSMVYAILDLQWSRRIWYSSCMYANMTCMQDSSLLV